MSGEDRTAGELVTSVQARDLFREAEDITNLALAESLSSGVSNKRSYICMIRLQDASLHRKDLRSYHDVLPE
jgi:hypothetical protein